MKNTTKVLTFIACAPLLGACSNAQTRADHAPNVPESGQAIHQAPADGNLGDEELEEPDPQANVVKGDPPGYPEVMATWSDPVGEPPTWRDSAVGLHDGLIKACGLDGKIAYFAYDSAGLSEVAKKTLGDLATCFTTGPLKGQTMSIVGHTDPRGTDKYNQELGMSRADSVAQYLIKQGMPKDQLDVESVGEKEASENPTSWPNDRRVNISIAETE
jgi:peptidoglycan-associated lipoprotein